MIPLEALRNWHHDSAKIIQKAFPGLKMNFSNQWNIAWQRFEFAVVIYPPGKQPVYLAEAFTLKQLETEIDVVFEMMKFLPQSTINKIRRHLAV